MWCQSQSDLANGSGQSCRWSADLLAIMEGWRLRGTAIFDGEAGPHGTRPIRQTKLRQKLSPDRTTGFLRVVSVTILK